MSAPDNLTLLTDLYQLTMAYGYWKSGLDTRRAVFHLFFRSAPFGGGYAIAAGLQSALDWLGGFGFGADDLAYLASLEGGDGRALFEPGFLEMLGQMRFSCDVDAIREGTVVFAQEPLVRIEGPLIQCQLVETALLSILNFQTLIATKAARVVRAAGGDTVLEFGLRRAQGPDGGLSASRAAYVGGVHATSNVLAGKVFGIPVRGTHAHSWVMCFEQEHEAFMAYAQAMPNNCVFLVDTYDTLGGVEEAIKVGRWLREQGHELGGVRLDSGDLAWLSQQARRKLDEAGFQDAVVVASNDLDEGVIEALKAQGACIGVWGVGTKLSTAFDQPALGGVYKLAALQDESGRWQEKIKLSEQAIKTSNPGILQVRRVFSAQGEAMCDMIFDTLHPPAEGATMVDPLDDTRRRTLPAQGTTCDLLEPVCRDGKVCVTLPTLEAIRSRTGAQLAQFHPGVTRHLNPHQYPVGLELGLYGRKRALILQARGHLDD